MEHVLKERHWNGDTYERENGELVTEISGKHVNFLDADGAWKPIDCTIEATEDCFEVTQAPFYAKFPLYADEETYFEANCRYDIFKGEEIKEEPVGRYMKCMMAEHVPGELYDLNGNGRVDAVLYRNAIPSLSADLIYFAQHGRAPRLQQLIRFNAVPDGDQRLTFRVHFTHDLTIEKHGHGYRHHLKGMRGMGFKKFEMWDSNGRRRRIEVEYLKDKGVYWFTKLIPKSFFTQKGLPVYTDDTATIYPDPDPESTTFDGRISLDTTSLGTTGWASVHDASDGSSGVIRDSTNNITVQAQIGAAGYYGIGRGWALFDTSAIPSVNGITSATVSVIYTTSPSLPDAGMDNVIVASTPTSNTALAGTDWSHIGSTLLGTISGTSTSVYNVATLNASGIAAINKGGITKLGFRISRDQSNSAPTVGNNVMDFYSADQAGTSSDPKLVVVHNAPPTAPSDLAVASSDGSSSLILTWTDNSSDEDNFLVERSNDGSTGWAQIASKAANAVTHTDALATFDLTRYYRVRGYRSSDTTYSSYTSVASATTAPAIPTSLAAVATSNQIALTWSDTSTTLTQISIERKIGSGSYAVAATVAAGVQAYVDTDVMDLNSYTYRIRAYRGSDARYSGYSGTVVSQPAPGTPFNLDVSAISASTSLSIAWVDNSNSESNFRLERSTNGSAWSEIIQPAANATSYTDPVATADVLRYYRIRAYRSSDTTYSGYSGSDSAYTAPAAPSSLLLSRGETTMSLTWTNAATTQTEFRIERATNGAGYVQIGTATAASFTDAGINPQDTYAYRVRAYRSGDQIYSGYCTPASSAGSVTVADVSLYGGCIDGTAGAAKIQLFWTSTNVSDESYVLQRSPNGSTGWATVAAPSNTTTTYTNTGLTAGTTYYYRVSNVVSGATQTTSAVVAIKATPGKAGDLQLAFLRKIRNFPS